MKIKKTTKNIVASAATLGVGGMALEGMGQGALIPKTIGKGASMIGVAIPAMYGMEVMNMVAGKKKKRY